MNVVGIFGGSFVYELGTAVDMQFFFDCIQKHVVRESKDAKWQLLSDRLYRRYVKQEDLLATLALMEEVKTVFSNVNTCDVEESYPPEYHGTSKLDFGKKMLADLFFDFFDRFAFCKESAERFQAKWNQYLAVRVVVANMPGFIEDKMRKLEQYDNLTGKPLWMR
jgi:hypothetical protein